MGVLKHPNQWRYPVHRVVRPKHVMSKQNPAHQGELQAIRARDFRRRSRIKP